MNDQQLRILLVEDNPGDAHLIRELLSENTQPVFEVATAARLSEGLAKLAAIDFDAVLLDLSLPDSQGESTLRKTLATSPQTPVVVLTGLDDDATGIEALKQGAEDYLVKGRVASHLLVRAIRYAIERRHIQENVRDSQQFLQLVLNTLGAHIAILDETGTITDVNAAWRQFADVNGLDDPLHGVGANYLTVCDDAASRGDADAAAVTKGVRQILAGESSEFVLEYPCHGPDEQRWFTVEAYHFELNGQRRVVMTHHNITERVLTEHAERDQRQLAEALSQTAAMVNSTLELDQVLEAIVANVRRVVPHDAAYIVQIEGDRARMRSASGFEHFGGARNGEPFVIAASNMHDLQRITINLEPVVVSDSLHESGWFRLVDAEWARSFAAAPIARDGQILGLLCVLSSTPSFFSATHAGRLQGLANQAAIAIRNAQLYRELGNYSEYLEEAMAQRTAELQESEARFRQIAEHIRAVFWIDSVHSTRVEYVSPAYADVWGRSREALYRDPREWQNAIHPDDRARVEQEMARLVQGNYDIEYRIIRPDGSIRWIHDRGYPIHNGKGEVYRIVGIAEDITAIKRSTAALEQALAREMEINDMRSRFISMASHDLRTPLSVIQSSADMLQRYSDRMSEDRKQAKLTQILTTIEHMVALLDDILLLGKTEAGKIEFNPKPIELATFCHTILSEIQAAIGTKHNFRLDVDGACSTLVADPKLLRHMLYNLLSNAIKYSPEGSTVTFEVTSDCDQTVITIQDEGIGIPTADQERLFEAFHRASNVGSVAGTGLGLAIVKQSVDLHNGRITFASQENKGTTFKMFLPEGSEVAV